MNKFRNFWDLLDTVGPETFQQASWLQNLNVIHWCNEDIYSSINEARQHKSLTIPFTFAARKESIINLTTLIHFTFSNKTGIFARSHFNKTLTEIYFLPEKQFCRSRELAVHVIESRMYCLSITSIKTLWT